MNRLDLPRILAPAVLVLLAAGLFAAWIGLGIGGEGTVRWVDDSATALAALTATVLCARARQRHTGRMRLFFTLLACATACWTLAEVMWGVYDLILHDDVPVPSWADVGYLGAIPLTVAALLVHPATRGTGTRKARSVFDGLSVATALLFLSWTLVLGPLWRSTDLSTAGGLVSVAYPFGDVVIIFFIVLAVRGMTRGDRLSLWFLLSALLAMALADSGYSYLTEVKGYTTGHLIDTGWVLAYLGIALAAHSSQARVTVVPRAETSGPTLASMVSPLLPVLAGLSVATLEIKLGNHLDRAAWSMAFVLVGLVLVRQALLVLELVGPHRHGGESVVARLTNATLGSAIADPASSTPHPPDRP